MTTHRTLKLLLLTLPLFAAACRQAEPTGTWRGTIRNHSGEQVAFTLAVARQNDQLVGTLVNGDDRVPSSNGKFDGRVLTLRYDFYAGELTATLAGDRLTGVFERQWGKQTLRRELTAQRGNESAAAGNPGGDVNGEWILRVGAGEQQRLWRAAVQQQGTQARGTIIPVSGDWGAMTGTFVNGALTLNRFDGINCRVFKAQLTPQGTLAGVVDLGLFDPPRQVVGERLTAANQTLVAALPDPNNHTRMSKPAEPFKFSFPDLDGKLVSAADERFKHKVVVVTITGSWCPNCHDEAPVLEDFYQRYRAQGLEVVALGFEYTGDVPRDLAQLRLFAQRHGVTYPTLLAGSTDEAPQKLAQLVNFGAYPTTIFIGRDGLVKRIHAGFEGKATGARHQQLKAELEALIKELLAETAS